MKIIVRVSGRLENRSEHVLFAGFLKDHKVATRDIGGTIHIRNVADGSEIGSMAEDVWKIELDSNGTWNLLAWSAISSDGEWLAIVSPGPAGRVVKIWNVMTNGLVTVLPIARPDVNSIAFSPNKKLLAIFSGGEGISLWNIPNGRKPKVVPVTSVYKSPGSVRFSPDGKLLAFGDGDGWVHLISLTSGDPIVAFQASMVNGVASLAFSPDGRSIAVGFAFGDPRIVIYDVVNQEKLKTLDSHRGFVASLAFSPDGKILASGSADQTIKLWNTRTWQEEFTLIGHEDEVWCVDFSPDGKSLVSCGKDGATYLWPAETSRLARGHHSVNLNLSAASWEVSPDAKNLVADDSDGGISLWDVALNARVKAQKLGTNNLKAVWSN
ncbi:MAG TPA: WD40 repeat domain-containing protein, partial [Verrucomicrobiae bacterium]|nr:WD40 repeat domain-containing protein [Verrucomicrobiae bacterium]